MSTTVSFPGLGLAFSIDRVAFSIGNFDIYWYGILIGLGLALGMIYAVRHAKEFGIDADRMLDVIIVGTIFGVIGARLYYVVFAPEGMFTSFQDLIDTRKGGVAFYGAVIGAILSAVITCKIRKVKLLPMIDVASVGFLIGQGIGRWGNFFNQEAFGTNTTLPWGMTSDTVVHYLTGNAEMLKAHNIFVDPAMPVHPTFLYESLWCLLGAVIFMSYAKRRKFDGEMTLLYFAWNGFGRAFIEGMRTDSLYWGDIRVSQLLAIVGAVLAMIAVFVVRLKINKSDNPDYLIPYGHTEKAAAELAAFEKERLAKSKKDGGDETDADEDTDDGADEDADDEAVTAPQEKAKPVPASKDGGRKSAKPVSRKLDADGNELEEVVVKAAVVEAEAPAKPKAKNRAKKAKADVEAVVAEAEVVEAVVTEAAAKPKRKSRAKKQVEAVVEEIVERETDAE